MVLHRENELKRVGDEGLDIGALPEKLVYIGILGSADDTIRVGRDVPEVGPVETDFHYLPFLSALFPQETESVRAAAGAHHLRIGGQ